MTRKTAPPPISNVLSVLPPPGADEAIETLLKGQGIRLERIVSHGHVSPAGFWLDQDEAEWVLVMSGRARLLIEGEGAERELGPGDSLFLPAHCRHRVSWTQPGEPTIWLAIFIEPRLAPLPVA